LDYFSLKWVDDVGFSFGLQLGSWDDSGLLFVEKYFEDIPKMENDWPGLNFQNFGAPSK
jgi:hypothetical protein